MPELKLGLNDKLLFESQHRTTSKGKAVEMEDVKFHLVCLALLTLHCACACRWHTMPWHVQVCAEARRVYT